MKKLFFLSLVLMVISASQAQIVNDIAGKLKVGQVDQRDTASSIVVRLPDGTLGVRDASTVASYQMLSISNDTIYLENGGYIVLPEQTDSDPTNELQTFSVSDFGDTLYLNNGNHIIIPLISVTNRPTKDYLIGGSGYDIPTAIKQTLDSGYIVAGYSNSPVSGDVTSASNGYYDYWIVKMNGSGNIQWDNLIGGSNGELEPSIQQTLDSGYIVAGYSGSSMSGDVSDTTNGNDDYWIVKMDGSGNIEWDNLIGGSESERKPCIQQTSDGGYIVAGQSYSSMSGDVTGVSNGRYDYWIVKMDGSGNIQWDNLIGGSLNELEPSIQQTSDGGYIVAGHSGSSMSGDVTGVSNGNNDYWIVKLDGSGNIQWDNLIGGSGSEIKPSIQQTSDGGYIVVGQSYSSMSGDVSDTTNGSSDYWIVKLDGSGNIQWDNLIGGSNGELEPSMQQTSDGGYILAGRSSSSMSGDVTDVSNGYYDYWIVKLDSGGNIQWNNLIGGTDTETAYSIQQTTDGGYIVSGETASSLSGDVTDTSNGNDDYWIVKLDANGNIENH